MNNLSWQTALKNAVTEPQQLLELLELNSALLPAAQQAAKLFPLRVPRGFIARMQKGEPLDPLLQQVLPLGAELIETSGYVSDPLQEKSANPLPGLLHKYHGRVLLTVTSACGVNCRFCFRREFPYAENNPGVAGWEAALQYIAADPSIHEVILSGGDPMVAADKQLAALTAKIAEISHVTTLRIHTRLPIVLPERITAELIQGLTTTRLQGVMVLHCNHAQEIDAHVIAAMKMLQDAGITLLNQSVLLKGINDSVVTLVALSKKLFSAGILPYYLHQLDKVRGVAHFEVDDARARDLVAHMTQQLPGYLVPKLVREIPGVAAKVGLSVQPVI